MSRQLINRSPDLLRLREEQFNVRYIPGHVVVWDIPYLDQNGDLQRGSLISTVTLHDDVATAPDDHTIYFAGVMPYDKDGRALTELLAGTDGGSLPSGLSWNFRFSQKPTSGQPYANFYDKFRRYISFLVGPARARYPGVTAATCQPIEADPEDSVFVLEDTWSPKARISTIVERQRRYRIAIVGVGGTGAHALDLLAKTPVAEIHLYDGDAILQRNVLRLPGATSRETVRDKPNKALHYARVYADLRRNIHGHAEHIDETNISQLQSMDFVFICIDKGAARGVIATYLAAQSIPFIDVGMGLTITEDEKLTGMVRTTLVAPGSQAISHLPCQDNDPDNDIYDDNVQTVELNSLNAAFAVIRWKKYCGIYAELKNESNSLYTVSTNKIISRA